MAKKQKEDAVIKNLKGFVRLGAETNSPGNISTGHFDLDFAIHHGCLPGGSDLSQIKNYDSKKTYGMPRGKIVEVFGEEGGGKSSLAYRVCGFAQKMGYSCAWIDTEHSFSDDLAQINGMDRTEVYYSDMSNENDEDVVFHAEDVFDAIIALCKSGVKVIVLDSVANLVPKARMEKEAAKQTVGIVARLMSENLGKIANYASKYGVLIIFINQLREKIGIMFGCFHYNARVLLADGSTEKIGKIVNNQMNVEVMSYNREKNIIEPKKIIDWHDNGNIQDDESFLQIVTEKFGGNGRSSLPCTSNHILFKCRYSDFWKDNNSNDEVILNNILRNEFKETPAGDLNIGDFILAKQPFYLNDEQRQVVYGSILGDGCLRASRNNKCYQLRLGHSIQQKDYLNWKKEILASWIGYEGSNKDGLKVYADTIPMYELRELKYKFNKNNRVQNIIPEEIADNLDLLGLTIWYLDDGSFSGSYSKWGNGKSIIYCTKFNNREIMLPAFKRLGLDVKLNDRGFVFDSENTKKLHNLICKFVHGSMQYKLHPDFRNKYDYEIEDVANIEYKLVPVKILDIYEKPKTRTKKKFDLAIDDNSTYFVDGVLVHNSPETTPGGRSLKHNSSLRIQISKKGGKDADIYVEDEDGQKRLIGRTARCNVRKNRFAKPFFEGIEIPIYFEPYFPDIEDIMFSSGRQLQVIKVRKGEFSWGDLSKIEGRRNFIDAIKEKSLQSELYRDILKAAYDNGVFLPPELSQWAEDNYEEPTVVEDNSEADNASEANEKRSTRGRKKKDSTSSSSDD